MSFEQRFGPPPIHAGATTHLAEVVSVQDPDGLNRIQIRLLTFDNVADQDAPIWARVAVPFAGANRGAFFIPGIGEEVVVNFINGDPRHPVVVGSLWNGGNAAPESLSKDEVDRWSFVGTQGTRIAIVEENAGQAKIELTTPSGVSGTFTDEGGGKIEFSAMGSTIKIDSSGVSIETGSTVSIKGSQMEVNAGMVTVNAGISKFSGVVTCDVLQTNTVISTTYTPGAGNVW